MNETITELQNIWSKVKEELAKTVEDSRFFDVFLSESSIHSIEEDIVLISVNSNLAVTILGSKYIGVIQDAVKNVLHKSYKVKFSTKDELKVSVRTAEIKPTYFKTSSVNPALTFDSFITGPCNLEAKQAALYIATNPGKGFNPLYIYSNPGLGKTHLLHAIVNYIHETQPGKKALYCDGNEFVQEYVNFTTGAKQEESLKDYILSYDVLLIDDIQNLATRERTTDFFFNIYNQMRDHGKQIVITSDKNPEDLKYFEERLKSRFASGLTVNISQPDVDTCIAILQSKINNSLLDLNSFSPKVIEFVAAKFSKSIREIEGAFNKLLHYATIFRPTKYIDMDFALEALQSLIDVKDAKQKMNEQRIIEVVSDYYNITPSQLQGTSRQGKIAMARHIAMYLIRKMLDTSYQKIGMIFGGKDHSTVISGVEKVEKELEINTALETAINDIKNQLKS